MKPRRTQAARSQATRDQIVQAALTVFALKGYGAASMDDICLAAGCSKGGLYHHFASKPAVLGGVVGKLAALGALTPPFGSQAGLPADALGRVVLDIWGEASRDGALREQLRAANEVSPQDTGQMSRLLAVGALIQALTRGEEVDPASIAAQLGIERAA